MQLQSDSTTILRKDNEDVQEYSRDQSARLRWQSRQSLLTSLVAHRTHHLHGSRFLRRLGWFFTWALLAVFSFWCYRKQDFLFNFDDAGMFFRYAMNMRQGAGIVWNLHGPHTFGITSLPWLFVVFLASFASFRQPGAEYSFHQISHFLVSLSWATGVVAILLLSWTAVHFGRRRDLRTFSLILIGIYVPLLLSADFGLLAACGMETMLAFLLITAFAGSLDLVGKKETGTRLSVLSVASGLMILTRPEAVVVAITMPILYSRCMRKLSKRVLSVYYVSIALFLAAAALAAHFYFGVALPLAFYIKSEHAYANYQPYLDRGYYLSAALNIVLIPLTIALCTYRKEQAGVLKVYGIPFLLTSIYLLTVEQIMGWRGRYYFPYCALLLLAACRVLIDQKSRLPRMSIQKGLAFAALIFISTPLSLDLWNPLAQRLVKRRTVSILPKLAIVASQPLPVRAYIENYESFLLLAKASRRGSTIGLSEVGFTGAMLPQMNLIDTAGLNATDLATDGFQMSDIYSHHPDLLWLMNPEYSELAGRFLTDPHLLSEYDVYAEVFGYGVAIRRDSPSFGKLEAALNAEFIRAYGPTFHLQDYHVRSISWDPNATRRGSVSDIQRL